MLGVEAIATQIVDIVDIVQQGAIDEDNTEIRRFARSTIELHPVCHEDRRPSLRRSGMKQKSLILRFGNEAISQSDDAHLARHSKWHVCHAYLDH